MPTDHPCYARIRGGTLFIDAKAHRDYQKHMNMTPTAMALTAVAALSFSLLVQNQAGQPSPEAAAGWKVGMPIVTYWAGPPMTDTTARQMADGGFNLVWCTEKELDTAQRHGLRAMLHDALLSPGSLDAPEQRGKLESLIDRVRRHPALYAFFITDEPSAAAFPALGRLVAFLRERDPAHLAYINLFPTYASNEQLGTKGDLVTAYAEHLKQYISVVKPALVSYDHYQFKAQGDGDQYFLNLAMIRRTSQESGVPFLNIVQACTWTPSMRVPNSDEMRYLVYTTLAYGAQGISYYVYCCQGHTGGIALPDGTPTPIYDALKTLNREFVTIARETQPLRSIAVYHTALKEQGCEPLPPSCVFKLEQSGRDADNKRGLVLGLFGQADKPTHVLLANLDYREARTATLVGPGRLARFQASANRWEPAVKQRLELELAPGGGVLVKSY